MSKIWRFELTGQNLSTTTEFMSTVHYQTDVPLAGSEPSARKVLDELVEHYSTSGTGLQKWVNCMYGSAKLTRVAVREEVTPGSGDIPEVAADDINLAGTLGSIGGDQLPRELALWLKFGTAAAIRSGRGGTHIPPVQNASLLDGAGGWDTTTAVWTAVVALAASVLDKLEDVFGSPETGDINPVVYSRTRRARGLTPYAFELTTVIPSPRPRWVSRRED